MDLLLKNCELVELSDEEMKSIDGGASCKTLEQAVGNRYFTRLNNDNLMAAARAFLASL